MPLRHSKPAQPWSTHSSTSSSHGSPAAAVSSTTPRASRVSMPRSAILMTRPSTPSSATTRFEPPPGARPLARLEHGRLVTRLDEELRRPPDAQRAMLRQADVLERCHTLENIASPRIPSHAALHPGIELVAQPVADQVDPEDEEQD